MRDAFWELPLEQLDTQQWEALCDGCGRCCLVKLQDDEDDQVYYTNLACRYLDTVTCRCTQYPQRKQKQPGCLQIDLAFLEQHAHWLPSSCAYRRRYRNEPLEAWHPLLSGNRFSTREAGISVAERVISERLVPEHQWEDHVIRWIE